MILACESARACRKRLIGESATLSRLGTKPESLGTQLAVGMLLIYVVLIRKL
jgi:hypothetical protein